MTVLCNIDQPLNAYIEPWQCRYALAVTASKDLLASNAWRSLCWAFLGLDLNRVDLF